MMADTIRYYRKAGKLLASTLTSGSNMPRSSASGTSVAGSYGRAFFATITAHYPKSLKFSYASCFHWCEASIVENQIYLSRNLRMQNVV
jgi:hypothetical protein